MTELPESGGPAVRQPRQEGVSIAVRLVNDAASLAADAARRVIPPIVNGQQPPPGAIPQQIPVPNLGTVSREGQGIFQIPQTFTQIAEICKRHTDPRTGHFDMDAAREEFDRLLGDRFTQQQKTLLFAFLAGLYLTALHEGSADGANQAAKRNDTAARDAAVAVGNAASIGLVGLGSGTSESNDYRWGQRANQDLSDQQRADLYNAMLQAGFNQAAVFRLAGDIGTRRNLLGSDDVTLMQFLMNQATMQTAQLAADVRELEERRGKSERDRVKYEREYARLCAFVGGEAHADEVMDARGERMDPVAQAAVNGQYLRSRLDAGDLTVVPSQLSQPPTGRRSRHHAR